MGNQIAGERRLSSLQLIAAKVNRDGPLDDLDRDHQTRIVGAFFHNDTQKLATADSDALANPEEGMSLKGSASLEDDADRLNLIFRDGSACATRSHEIRYAVRPQYAYARLGRFPDFREEVAGEQGQLDSLDSVVPFVFLFQERDEDFDTLLFQLGGDLHVCMVRPRAERKPG
jgi:hypothetical protein